MSGKLRALTYHLNFGGGLDRRQSNPFVLWGVIAELPLVEKLRLVGEINGESVRGKTPDNSALLGFIWKSPWRNISLDAGLRRGISRAGADWIFTTGLTFSFSLATSTQVTDTHRGHFIRLLDKAQSP